MRKDITESMDIPGGITVEKKGTNYTVTGPKGKASREFIAPNVDIKIENNKLVISSRKASKKEKALVNSYKSHFKNIFTGVEKKYIYKLKICSGHFPMNVSFANGILNVKNFIGEKFPRTLKINPGVSVKIEGNNVTLEGVDKEIVGQTAANIEQLTRRPGFDRRIFQDGIFIISKAEKGA